jgi:hypothetical protein
MVNKLLTVSEVAAIMQISDDAVTDRFTNVTGVINLGQLGGRRKLRIPLTVLESYLSRKAGRTVAVTVPDRPERRRRHDDWENKAVLNLAQAARQNECTDARTLLQIAHKAAFLARAVDETLWAELLDGWLDGEDSDEVGR